MRQVKITFTVDMPDDAIAVVETPDAEILQVAGADNEYDAALRWMEGHAPASHQAIQHELLDRLHSELGIAGSPPASGDRPYLNFYADPRFGTSRVGALAHRTSRVYAAIDPMRVEDFPNTEPAEGRYLTLYVRDPEDIDSAVSLIQAALNARGWGTAAVGSN
jgi:hypothetical protein